MQRFFNDLLRLEEASTSVKIINHLKKLFQQSENSEYAESLSGKLYQPVIPLTYYQRQPVDEIEHNNILVKKLSDAILKTIDYKKYKILPKALKDEIKRQIAKKLLILSPLHESTYIITEPDHETCYWGGGHSNPMISTAVTVKGLSISLWDKGDYSQTYFKPTRMHFPNDLFDEAILKNVIKEVCEMHADEILLEQTLQTDLIFEL